MEKKLELEFEKDQSVSIIECNNEEVEKNELLPECQELRVGIFSNELNVKKVTSLDLNDENNINLILNATQDVDSKLNDCIGREIVCVGFLATERQVDTINEETGELITRKKHTLMLFDKDNKSYVTGSNACYMSFENIVSLKGVPSKNKPLVLIPIKTDAKEKGHSYLKLKIKC